MTIAPDPAARIALVRATIARAAADAQRDPAGVTLIAISKTQPPELIAQLLAAGHRHFGENRVQEAAAKWPGLREHWPDVRLAMVGQLQSNKAADAVRLFDAIHSLDRTSLVDALGRAMDRAGRLIPCFVQVDLAGEPGRGGCPPAQLGGLIAAARTAGLPIAGLMTVPPVGREPAPWFALAAKLADDHGLKGLSMGMSGDYATAVRIGATHVRVGSALFGARN